MSRSLTTRKDPVPGARSVNAGLVIDTVRVVGLVVVVITVSLARPSPATGGPRGTAIAVMLGVCAAAWITWILSQRRDGLMTGSLVVMGAAGGVLAGLSPASPAVAVGCVAVFAAGARLSTVVSLGITAGTVAGFLATGLVVGIPTAELLGYAWAFVGLWTIALTRNEFLVRAVSAERTLVETRRAWEAETQAAALAERARIARDLHDVLAHSLAAVSVNLQAAEGLLTSGTLPEDNPELVKAIECVNRAGNLTRDGLAAAKRAVLALRDDAAPPSRAAGLAGRSVPHRRRPGGASRGQRRGPADPGGGQRGRVPDGAGGADQRAQARARSARHSSPWLRSGPGHAQRRQPGTGRARRTPAGRYRRRLRPGWPAGAGRAGGRYLRSGPGRPNLAGKTEDSRMTDNPQPVTVVVADDQAAVREGLVLLLGTLPGITVVGQAEDGAAAVQTVAATDPQVVLMDLNMPRLGGVEATGRIRADHPQTQVVVLTTYSDDESIIGALQAGALGYLTKDATRAEIGRAVLAAAAGQAVLDPAVQQRLLLAAARAPAAQPDQDHDPDELTPRESDVLRLIAEGRSNREIARALYVSEATVKTHVNRIFAKTGSRDRSQAIRYAYTHGYANPARSS